MTGSVTKGFLSKRGGNIELISKNTFKNDPTTVSIKGDVSFPDNGESRRKVNRVTTHGTAAALILARILVVLKKLGDSMPVEVHKSIRVSGVSRIGVGNELCPVIRNSARAVGHHVAM